MSSKNRNPLGKLMDATDNQARADSSRQNTWTSINSTMKPPSAAPSARSLPTPDENDSNKESAVASQYRSAILASADRMYKPKTAHKRKSLNSPPSPWKKRAITATRETAAQTLALPSDKSISFHKLQTSQTFEATQLNQTLLPLRPNTLNAAPTSKKRLVSEAFPVEMESQPAKRAFTGITEFTPAAAALPFLSEPNNIGSSNISKSTDAVKHFINIENLSPCPRDDSPDLFDDEDASLINEFLEAEKKLLAQSSTALNKKSDGTELIKSSPENVVSRSATVTNSSSTTPMKPFVRSFIPLPSSSDTSPIGSMVSPLHRSPICFRIAEALRYISSTFFAETRTVKTLNLEIYAFLNASVERQGVFSITFADIFFPAKPPYLNAIANPATTALSPTQKEGSAFSTHVQNLKKRLIRAVVQVTPDLPVNRPPTTSPIATPPLPVAPTNLSAKCSITALKIEQTTWNEIQRMKDILDEKLSMDGSSSGKEKRRIVSVNGSGSHAQRHTRMEKRKDTISPSPTRVQVHNPRPQ